MYLRPCFFVLIENNDEKMGVTRRIFSVMPIFLFEQTKIDCFKPMWKRKMGVEKQIIGYTPNDLEVSTNVSYKSLT